MAARILAIVAAVAMVIGALYARSRIDDRTERTGTTLRLVCATELAPVCEALADDQGTRVEATVEPAATTADTLTKLERGAPSPLHGWLVTAPWPTIVAEARQRAGRDALLSAGDVLARSPVVLAVRADRNQALEAQCKGQSGWKCLGEAAGRPWTELPGGRPEWGRVKPGHPGVASAAGLTVMGGATVAFFGGRLELSSTDLDDDAYFDWLSNLERAVPLDPPSPFQTMLQRPSAFDAVGALEAEAGPLLVGARNAKPVLIYPSPVTTADVVLGTTGGRAGELLADLVSGPSGGRALAASGWRVEGVSPVAGVRTSVQLPPTSNLPEPGVLDALRQRVAQASG